VDQGPSQPLDAATAGRLTEMLGAARAFADRPLTGVGPGTFKYYASEYASQGGLRLLEGPREAHNLYLGIAAETGAFGLACFLTILMATLLSLDRARRQCTRSRPVLGRIAAGFVLVLAIYMTTGLFLHFAYARYFWLMLGLAGAAGHIAATHPQ
jgi:O-antigen ligase